MAIIKDFCLIYTEVCSLYQFEDKINWGSPEQDRNQASNVLLAAYVNEKGVNTFLNIDSTPYLSKLIYDINNTVDGHYLYELLRIPIYNVNVSYVKEVRDVNDVITNYANLIYYPGTNKHYKAKEPSLNVAPDAIDGATYWEEILDFTHDDIRANNTIVVYDYHDIYTCRSRKCVRDAIIALGCGCEDHKKFLNVWKKKGLLAGAQSLADNQQYTKAETNLRVLENMCPKC